STLTLHSPTSPYSLSLHDALPIYHVVPVVAVFCAIVHATHKSHFAIHHCDLHMIACKPGVAHSAGLHRRSFLEVSHHIVWWHKTDRKSTRLNSSHVSISFAVFCLK